MTGLKLPSRTGLPTGLPTELPSELHPAAAGSRRGSRGARESPTNWFSKSSFVVKLLCMAASADRERNLRGLGHVRRAGGIPLFPIDLKIRARQTAYRPPVHQRFKTAYKYFTVHTL